MPANDEFLTSGGGVNNGNGLKWCMLGASRPCDCNSIGCGWALRPSCGEIFRRKCGECNLGFGLALCRFRLRRELNIIEHPSTVHLCISRKCTAEKWILSAPLSQNVFKQTLHWTRFLPVAGFMNCVPKFRGNEPQLRLAGECDFRNCARFDGDWLIPCDWRERELCCDDIDFGLRLPESRLRFSALELWCFMSSWRPRSRASFFDSLRASWCCCSIILFDLAKFTAELFIRLENCDAIKLAANGFKAFGCGGNGNGKWCPAIAIFINPAAWFWSAALSFALLPDSLSFLRAASWAAATCCKWWRSSRSISGLNRPDELPIGGGGNPDKPAPRQRKSNGCIFCRWFNGLDDELTNDAIAFGEWRLLFVLAFDPLFPFDDVDDDAFLKNWFKWLGGNPAANFWCIWFVKWSCEWANEPRCMFIGWVANCGGDDRLLGDITICFCNDSRFDIDWFAFWNCSADNVSRCRPLIYFYSICFFVAIQMDTISMLHLHCTLQPPLIL